MIQIPMKHICPCKTGWYYFRPYVKLVFLRETLKVDIWKSTTCQSSKARKADFWESGRELVDLDWFLQPSSACQQDNGNYNIFFLLFEHALLVWCSLPEAQSECALLCSVHTLWQTFPWRSREWLHFLNHCIFKDMSSASYHCVW